MFPFLKLLPLTKGQLFRQGIGPAWIPLANPHLELNFNRRLCTKRLLVHGPPNVSPSRVCGQVLPHSQGPTLPVPSVRTSPSDPCKGSPVQVPGMLLGLLPLSQPRSEKVTATYEVDHDEIIVGIATAAPAGAI